MLTEDIKDLLDSSVLIWLASVDETGIPNVSPKEVFSILDDAHLLIAHIASPQSIRNILKYPNVCVSFVDIFKQKGYKLKGEASIIKKSDMEFQNIAKPLIDITGEEFPVQAVIKIWVTETDPIIAPSYRLFPKRTEEEQISSAMQTYGVRPL